MKKKIYKTTITIEVLHEDENTNLSGFFEIAHEVIDGECSGQITNRKTIQLSGKKAVEAIEEQGSAPEFFQMDEKGNELE